MKITGKYMSSIHSSYVQFEVDEIPSNDVISEMRDKQSCYEAIWMGKDSDKNFSNGITLDIGMDDIEDEDFDLLLEIMSEEDVAEIKEIKETNY